MSYQILAQVMTNDVLREAKISRLANEANRLRKFQARQRLAKLACRFGLTETC